MNRKSVSKVMGMLIVLAMLISVLAACAATPAPAAQPTQASAAQATQAPAAQPTAAPAAQNIKLTMWKAPHSDQDEKFWTDTLAEFTKQNPGITVDYRVTPWDTFVEQYTTAYAGDNPPDVAYFPNSFFPKYAAAGQQVDLATLPNADIAKWKALHDPSIWNLGSYGGKQYGLPFLQIGISFIWNKAAFTTAGLDPNTPPKTWEELRTFGQKLTIDKNGKHPTDADFDVKNVVQWGYSIMDNTTGEMVNFVPVPIRNYGGEFLSADGKQWAMNDDKSDQGLQIQVDYINKDHIAPPFGTYVGHDIDKAFADGKIAMQLSYCNFVLPFRDTMKFDMGISMPPAGPANAESMGGIGYWNMAAKSKNKDAAWKLMEFLSSAAVEEAYTGLVKLFPCRTDINPFKDDAYMTAFGQTQRGYMASPILPFDYWSILMGESEAALTGQKNAKDALDTAAQRINDLMPK